MQGGVHMGRGGETAQLPDTGIFLGHLGSIPKVRVHCSTSKK